MISMVDTACDSITIRPAEAGDSGVLAEIMIAAWRSAFRGILAEDIIEKYTQFEGCRGLFDQLLGQDVGGLFLALLEGRPMGFVFVVQEGPEEARIEALLTVPDAWGRGVGAALMARALGYAQGLGVSSLHVWPFAENRRARRFYEKWGFGATGRERLGDAVEVEYCHCIP